MSKKTLIFILYRRFLNLIKAISVQNYQLTSQADLPTGLGRPVQKTDHGPTKFGS